MEPKEKCKRSSSFHRLKKILICSVMIISIPFLLCSCWMGIWLVGGAHAFDIADSMWVHYPNSELIREYSGGASCCVWDGKVFCSIDSAEIILNEFKKVLSEIDYRLSEGTKLYTLQYSKSDTFLDFATWLHDGEEIGPPYATIQIFEITKENKRDKCTQGSLIVIEVRVPAP